MAKARGRKSYESILAEYDRAADDYRSFAQALKELISNILTEHRVTVHSVTCRFKQRSSLVEKLNRPDTKYERLGDVTDICGIRIITYFEDAVDEIASILAREFSIDSDNTVDKRNVLNPDQFGYLSLHHIVTLRPERASLVEYRRFAGLKAEIQTRSILQHAWAEIEHDLGYRAGADVPRDIRRRFARLAGLLEIADEQFEAIRDSLREYERTVSDQIATEPEFVGLDQASLAAFVERSDLVLKLDKEFVAINGALLEGAIDPEFFRGDAANFGRVGIFTISQLEEALSREAPLIIAFSRIWLQGDDHKIFSRGISLLYLWYVLVARSIPPAEIRRMFSTLRFGGPDDELDSLVREVRKTYETACASLGLEMPPLPVDAQTDHVASSASNQTTSSPTEEHAPAPDASSDHGPNTMH